MVIVNNRRKLFGNNVGSIFTSRNIAESERIMDKLFSCEVISNVAVLCSRQIDKGFCNIDT